MTYVIASGNPFDGLSLHGVIGNVEVANAEAVGTFRGADWRVVELDTTSLTPWDNDLIQFARLICEIGETGALGERGWDELLVSMDLESDELSELFDRAFGTWESHKAALRNSGRAEDEPLYPGHHRQREMREMGITPSGISEEKESETG